MEKNNKKRLCRACSTEDLLVLLSGERCPLCCKSSREQAEKKRKHSPIAKPVVVNAEWKRFWFESNQYFDHVCDFDDWKRLRNAYPEMSDSRLLEAKEATYGGHRELAERNRKPNFGFRWEHDGRKTLGDFFKENGMSLTQNGQH